MWVLSERGFYSVVAYDEALGDMGFPTARSIRTDKVLVRVRAEEDMTALLAARPDLDVVELPKADYRFRAVMSKADWAGLLAEDIAEIDYTNFKSRILARQGAVRHNLYSRVWEVLLDLDERFSLGVEATPELSPRDIERSQEPIEADE